MEQSVRFYTESEEETVRFGRMIGEHAADGLFLALIGDLGTGKTHFVQGLAAGLGIEGAVTSPTFTIMNYYDGALPLKHFDFYRLDDEEELYNIGWKEYSAGGVTVAEWADLFPGVIPPEAVTVRLEAESETRRRITVSWGDRAPAAVTKEIETYALGH